MTLKFTKVHLKYLQHLSIDQYIFLMGIFIKQFYILPSGSFQLGDLLLIISAFIVFFIRGDKILIHKKELLLIYYFCFVTLINLLYSIKDGFFSSNYNRNTVYYLYNIIIVLLISYYIKFDKEKTSFVFALAFILKISLITQSIIYFGKFGRYEGGRYEGSFNDPNQYAVYIFFLLLLIFMIDSIKHENNIIWLFLGIYLLLPSKSTGVMLGVSFFLVSLLLYEFFKLKSNIARLGVIILIICLLLISFNITIKLPDFISNNGMYIRFVGKYHQLFTSDNSRSIITDRGWTRVFENPYYFIFGSGEGNHWRFNTNIEIHSSIIGPLFYYGIVPVLFLIFWIINNLKGIRQPLISCYAALLVESIFLNNLRQPFFWLLILLGSSELFKKKILLNN